MFSVKYLLSNCVKSSGLRYISSTSCLCGKKSREPFDKRFTVTAKMVNRFRRGGNKELEKPVALHVVQKTGITIQANQMFKNIPEMIPEFVVPDLTNFPLKAYVSYRTENITQTTFTARDLFNSCYAPEIASGIKNGQIQVEDGKIISDSNKPDS